MSRSKPDFTQGSRPTARLVTAGFILAEADAVDFRIGTDGCDLILAPPKGMLPESFASFRNAILSHAGELIDLILAKAEARR